MATKVFSFKKEWNKSRGYDVFISYARKDGSSLANELKTKLEKAGISTFLDSGAIENTEQFPERLKKEVERAKILLVLASSFALSREWIIQEIKIRLNSSKKKPVRILPVFWKGILWTQLPKDIHKLSVFHGMPQETDNVQDWDSDKIVLEVLNTFKGFRSYTLFKIISTSSIVLLFVLFIGIAGSQFSRNISEKQQEWIKIAEIAESKLDFEKATKAYGKAIVTGWWKDETLIERLNQSLDAQLLTFTKQIDLQDQSSKWIASINRELVLGIINYTDNTFYLTHNDKKIFEVEITDDTEPICFQDNNLVYILLSENLYSVDLSNPTSSLKSTQHGFSYDTWSPGTPEIKISSYENALIVTGPVQDEIQVRIFDPSRLTLKNKVTLESTEGRVAICWSENNPTYAAFGVLVDKNRVPFSLTLIGWNLSNGRIDTITTDRDLPPELSQGLYSPYRLYGSPNDSQFFIELESSNYLQEYLTGNKPSNAWVALSTDSRRASNFLGNNYLSAVVTEEWKSLEGILETSANQLEGLRHIDPVVLSRPIEVIERNVSAWNYAYNQNWGSGVIIFTTGENGLTVNMEWNTIFTSSLLPLASRGDLSRHILIDKNNNFVAVEVTLENRETKLYIWELTEFEPINSIYDVKKYLKESNLQIE